MKKLLAVVFASAVCTLAAETKCDLVDLYAYTDK